MNGLFPDEFAEVAVFPGRADGPVVFARYLTARQQIQIKRLVDAMVKAEQEHEAPSEEALAAVLAALQVRVSGWRGFSVTYGGQVEPLADLLSYGELVSLLFEAANAVQLKVNALGKSDSPSNSAGGGPAPTAPSSTGSGDAGTSPAKTSRSKSSA